jgi:UPF0716 protein FxsA
MAHGTTNKATVIRPALRYAVAYILVELAVLALLIWAVGLGWTVVLLAATFLVGALLAASQVKGQLAAVRRARRNPQGAVADGALVAAGSFLVLVPGILSTAAGALMLAPPTRSAMRPLAASLVSRGVLRQVRVIRLAGYASRVGRPQPRWSYPSQPDVDRRDYIDGEVLGEVIPRLPARG